MAAGARKAQGKKITVWYNSPMRSTHWIALLPLFLTAALHAQDRASEIDFENALRQARQPAAAYAAKTADRAAAVEATLTAMNDGPEVGGAIRSYIQDHALKIVFVDSVERSAYVPGTIQLGGSLPLYIRLLGPALTRETAGLMFSDMPDCAERRYMQLSLEVRSWLELGGDKSALPVLEPLAAYYKDAELAAGYRIWLGSGAETALFLISGSVGIERIEELESKAKTDAERASWQSANKRFVAFLLDEIAWRESNGYLLR